MMTRQTRSRTNVASSTAMLALATFSCLVLMSNTMTAAADPSDYLGSGERHHVLRGDMPAGVIGQARLAGRGPVQNYFQPVAFSGPDGVGFSMPQGSELFGTEDPSLQVGLLIGGVYRFRITGIPDAEGAELYPTVELIDRIYPPPGLATTYPIPINLDRDDLEAALEGRLVTRVIYLEDPTTAFPLAETPQTSRAIELSEHQDALEVADRMGRPVAIVRIGSVAPPSAAALMPQFFFGYPAWTPIYQPEQGVQQ
ncbi:putative secreted protein [Rhodopirellula maiorica SM1]|uniref:Putative secreted protein n=2 Tax=Novipirellula TaxID=2795426 RepID=M5RD77_9BACT|nr:putative secreted protein [Rhodopirellula maiorica SM1]